MTGEGARLGGASDLFQRVRDQIVRLGGLRREGLLLVGSDDIEAVSAWHRRWTALLATIRTQLDHEAPRQAELVLWPSVNGPRPIKQTRRELVQAAVGCRELELLVEQLGGAQRAALETSETQPPYSGTLPGRSFVGGGQRFEGAVMLRKLMEAARDSLVIVDQYMASGTFTLAAAAPDGIQRRFLSSNHRRVLREVTEAWSDWRDSWGGNSECRIGSELPHFRLLFIDSAAYHVDASLKDFGSRLTFYRMVPTDELRQIEGQIESMWRQATPV